MKPTLKVGDYAEVIKGEHLHNNAIGTVVKIRTVDITSKFPYQCTRPNGTTQIFKFGELRKCDPTYEALPSLTDLEQYRLSLGVYRQMINLYYDDLSLHGVWLPVTELIQINLLAEILEA